MVGGGNRRNEGSYVDRNTNVFAALSLRRKKKSDKAKGSLKASAGKTKESKEEKPQMYWAPAPLTVKSWADVDDDDDDDDYYATTAPPQALWAGSALNKVEETQEPDPVEETESEDDLLDEGDDDIVEENRYEQPEPKEMIQLPVESFPIPKETDRQLSKKEIKKKELAELDAILADFGLNPKENSVDEPSDAIRGKKDGQANGDMLKKNNAPGESKNAKKKKKKDKASKEMESPDQLNSADAKNGQGIVSTGEVEEDASATDVKERLKKIANAKKKKSNKDLDAAARAAAAAEAAARSAKLAAAKKKEKNHYNQQPIR